MPDGQAQRWVPWIARAGWIGVIVAGWEAIDAADLSSSGLNVARIGGAAMWLLGVAGLALPSVATLTIARVVVPFAVPVSALLWSAGGGVAALVALTFAVIAAIAVLTAEFAVGYVQASAYGAGDRFPLRPPVGYLVASVLVWFGIAAALIGAATLLANGSWVIGTLVSVLVLAAAAWASRRWHQLAQRWLVIVPAGLVIHDRVVLAETFMVNRQQILDVSLARAGTDATDLTGPAPGHALEVTLRAPMTALVMGADIARRADNVAVDAVLVAPTRPGAALGAYRSRMRVASPPPSTR